VDHAVDVGGDPPVVALVEALEGPVVAPTNPRDEDAIVRLLCVGRLRLGRRGKRGDARPLSLAWRIVIIHDDGRRSGRLNRIVHPRSAQVLSSQKWA
jgi:hypothetical protein